MSTVTLIYKAPRNDFPLRQWYDIYVPGFGKLRDYVLVVDMQEEDEYGEQDYWNCSSYYGERLVMSAPAMHEALEPVLEAIGSDIVIEHDDYVEIDTMAPLRSYNWRGKIRRLKTLWDRWWWK